MSEHGPRIVRQVTHADLRGACSSYAQQIAQELKRVGIDAGVIVSICPADRSVRTMASTIGARHLVEILRALAEDVQLDRLTVGKPS